MRVRRAAVLASLAVLPIVLASCSSEAGDGGGSDNDVAVETDASFPAGSTMEKLADAGSITVGVKYDQPGFGLVDPNGTPQGFDIEIAKIVAGKLGIDEDKITWKEAVSANREPFIEQGQVDMVVATYTINDDRKQVVDFAGPYYVAGQDIMVKADDKSIKGPEDLAGKTVCSVEGSTPAQNIRDKYPDANLQTFDVYSKCADALANGQADAVTTDNVILTGLVDQSEGKFKLVGKPFTEEPYGIGLQKGDDEFRNFINDALQESFDDGSWAKAWDSTAGEITGQDAPEPPKLDRY